MLRVQGETGKVSNPHGSSEGQGTQLVNWIPHLGVAEDSTGGILCSCLPCGILETYNLSTLPFCQSSPEGCLSAEKVDILLLFPNPVPAAGDCQVSPLPSSTSSIWGSLPAIVG